MSSGLSEYLEHSFLYSSFKFSRRYIITTIKLLNIETFIYSKILRYCMIKYLLAVMMMGLLMGGGAVVASGGVKAILPTHLLDDYIGGEKGIDVAIPQEKEMKVVKFNLAAFYKDILKISDTPDKITECREQQEQTFKACVESKMTSQQKIRYQQQMRQINDAIQLYKKHGGQLHEIPFVQDLMEEE